MITISKFKLENNLKYFRKIHVFSDVWLVSLYAPVTKHGFKPNFYNIIRYPLTLIFIPIRVRS